MNNTELAERLRKLGDPRYPNSVFYQAADALEVAGKRTVTTVEELDALPQWSVVQDLDREEYRKGRDGLWYGWGNDANGETPETVLWQGPNGPSATILYTPEVQP